MKKNLFLAIIVMTSSYGFAQQITSEMMQNLKQSYVQTASDRAIRNALAGADIKTLAVNQDNQNALDYHFTYRVPNKGITNQKQSGRCWMFCGLNVIRADVMQRFDMKELEFSEAYLFFYDQLEKSNLFLERMIEYRQRPADDVHVEFWMQHPITDGGSFTGVADLVRKYGVVPAQAMHETRITNGTAQYRGFITEKLREYALKIRDCKNDATARNLKEQCLKDVYRMLVLCFGMPPEQFTYTQYDAKDNVVSTETYTPASFRDKYIRPEMINNYFMFMNDPSREYYRVYDVQYDRHIEEGTNWCYINLPIEEMQQMAIASLKDSVAMYTGSDVNKFRDPERGMLDPRNFDYESLFGVSFPMDKAERIRTHTSGSSHAMSLVAVDLDKDGKPIKWLLENSWGDKAGWQGHLLLTDEWFHEYMFRLVVEEKYVPEKIKAIMKTKHILLPIWDPMSGVEE